jgi:tetratricopeptide (TPR) repeat protein
LLRAAAEAASRDAGDSSLESAYACNRLGIASKFAGRFDEAEAAYARALPIAESALEAEPDLLASLLHNLGGLAHSRGLYAEAEPFARRGLALREERCNDRPGVAADQAALAAILEGQERWAESEELYRRALEIWECEGDDYEIAMTLNGLAAVVRFSGRPEEAEPLFRRALEMIEAERGPGHPESATVRNNLAMLLNATGRAAEALPLLEQATKDLNEMLGPDHPATRDVRANRHRVAARFAEDGGASAERV